MDTVTLVEDQIENGQRLLDSLEEEGVTVSAACWLKPYESDRWVLYIATPVVEEKGVTEAYRQVLGVLRSLGDDWISTSDVMLVGEKHPLVKEARDILRRFPHQAATRLPRSLLGGIPVEEVYV